jgi:hypothetical protein
MAEPRKPETEKRKVEASVHICRGPVTACINGDHSQCTDTIDVRQFEREAWERGRDAMQSAAMKQVCRLCCEGFRVIDNGLGCWTHQDAKSGGFGPCYASEIRALTLVYPAEPQPAAEAK